MSELREFLRSIGLPGGDLNELPDSEKRFPDGAQYRVEIPSTEGPRCLEAVLEEAARLDVRVHRVSQGSGVFLLTDAELDEMARWPPRPASRSASSRARTPPGTPRRGALRRRAPSSRRPPAARSRSSPRSTTSAARPPTASAAS